MIEILSKAIQIQTTADVNDVNMKKLTDFLEESFPLVFNTFEKTNINGSLLLKLSGSGNPIMFCGHMDVVAAKASDWTHPPYSGVIDDEFVWGRGAIDCKNTVVGLLCAMENLLKSGFKNNRTIYLAFGHDEEIGGPFGASHIVKYLTGQGVRLDLVLDEGGHVSPEVLGDKNYATIALAEKNILRVKITAKNKGGHAAYISDKTGLYTLSKAIIAIEENPMPTRIIPLIQKYIDTLSKDYPQLVENYEDKPTNSPFVRTTIAPTMVNASDAPNILPTDANVICDIRMLPTQTVDEVLSHLKAVTAGLDLTFDVLTSPKGEGRATDFNSYFYKEVEKLIGEKFDNAVVVPALMAGGTDARHYEDICDVVLRFMPVFLTSDVSKTMHTANERIPIKSFERAVDFYQEFIKRHG